MDTPIAHVSARWRHTPDRVRKRGPRHPLLHSHVALDASQRSGLRRTQLRRRPGPFPVALPLQLDPHGPQRSDPRTESDPEMNTKWILSSCGSVAMFLVAWAGMGCSSTDHPNVQDGGQPEQREAETSSRLEADCGAANDPSLYTGTDPVCDGCPPMFAPDGVYVGNPCGASETTRCAMAFSAGGSWMRCCSGTWTRVGLASFSGSPYNDAGLASAGDCP